MNTRNSKHSMRRATALLGAIAASSFLGLPALAGGKVIGGTGATEQAQNPSSTMPSAQCASMNTSMATQSSLSEGATTLDATPDASKPGAAQVPNQADPRAGNTAADQAATRTDNQMADGSRTQMMGSSYQMTSSRPTSALYGNILGRGGVTAGGFANQRFVSANTPNAIREINSMSSADRGYSDRMYGTQYGNRDQASISGNVLARGGATTGGDANQQVMAANNDAMNGMNRAGMTGSTNSSMNTTGAMRSDSMRSDRMNRSSQSMMGNQVAQCPPGMMMPNRSMPNRSMPDMRDMRMMPGQSNNGTQPAPASNQVQPSPGDGSGAR